MNSLIESGGDLAIIVGGYNSSNTSHLVELCQGRLPAYYIQDADEIQSRTVIRHLSLEKKEIVISENWLPEKTEPLDILLAAGASCPDTLVEDVMMKILDQFGLSDDLDKAFESKQLNPGMDAQEMFGG